MNRKLLMMRIVLDWVCLKYGVNVAEGIYLIEWEGMLVM